jgi:hypothetical protein
VLDSPTRRVEGRDARDGSRCEERVDGTRTRYGSPGRPRETDTPREEGGKSIEIAVVTNVRRNSGGAGLTVTKRNLTFRDGLLVGQGKDYQVRVDAASALD